jgi:hypothetical protein
VCETPAAAAGSHCSNAVGGAAAAADAAAPGAPQLSNVTGMWHIVTLGELRLRLSTLHGRYQEYITLKTAARYALLMLVGT